LISATAISERACRENQQLGGQIGWASEIELKLKEAIQNCEIQIPPLG